MAHPYPSNRPWGDIYTIPTSAIDNIANRLIRDQQQRELQKRQEDKALDDEFGKNVAGVKSADIPDITKAYNDYKQAHIALQKKGAKATPQDQMDLMLKKQAAFSQIAASKEDKEYLALRAKEGKNNKRYNPNYQVKISEKLNTPTSKRNRDLDDDDLLYKYAMPDISKEILTATKRDDGTDFELLVGVDEKDPLKDKYEEYKRINPPNVFYNKLFFGLGSRSDNEGFTRNVIDNTTNEEKEKLRIAYETKIADPNFKKLYGETQPFPASAANTELGQAVALKVMEAVVNLPTEPIKSKSVLNADRGKDRNLDDWRTKQSEGFDWWLKENNITSQQKDRRMALTKNNQTYEIDNVPEILHKDYTVEVDVSPTWTEIQSGVKGKKEKRIYFDGVPVSYKSDVLGKNTAFKSEDGKSYVVVNPDGTYQSKTGVILPKDVYLNTIKRSTPWEKPEGTGKVDVRGNTVQPTKAKPKNNPLDLDF